MKLKFNDKLLFWSLGVIQPATPDESLLFLKKVIGSANRWPDTDEVSLIFEEWTESNLVTLIARKHNLYSLTETGQKYLPDKLRKHRDRTRIGLIKEAYNDNVSSSEGVAQGLDGDSPSLDARTTIKEASRPVVPGRESSQMNLIRLPARNYWPRFSEQLNLRVGLSSRPSDTLPAKFRYCSFPTLTTIHNASTENGYKQDMTQGQLALAIGISHQLIALIRRKKSKFYRSFTIKKKSGGDRTIESPRVFLKAIQFWIKAYFFHYLVVHDACHAYLKNRSIISNAQLHLDQEFVGNIDIENFFGSITKRNVAETLKKNGIGEILSTIFADLLTLEDHLPQGAPTSPGISNAYLFDFDIAFSKYTSANGLAYSRYADDLTISGSSRKAVSSAIAKAGGLLRDYNLFLNEEKTRIASRKASQRVTGIMVNEKLQPPRDFQRKVRALFHNASKNPQQYIERIDELYGYISYLSAFDTLRDSKHLRKYRSIARQVKAKNHQN